MVDSRLLEVLLLLEDELLFVGDVPRVTYLDSARWWLLLLDEESLELELELFWLLPFRLAGRPLLSFFLVELYSLLALL